METIQDERRKQIAIGVAIIGLITVTIVTVMLGWKYLPGVFGEWIGFMVGVMTTPFFLEGSCLFFGFMLVIFLNSWRRQREGDEFVYLEQVTGPEVPADLPDHAKWALYREAPLTGGAVSRLDEVEGAMAIGDFKTAAELLGAMEPAQLQEPACLRLRLALARATGRDDLARELERQIG